MYYKYLFLSVSKMLTDSLKLSISPWSSTSSSNAFSQLLICWGIISLTAYQLSLLQHHHQFLIFFLFPLPQQTCFLISNFSIMILAEDIYTISTVFPFQIFLCIILASVALFSIISFFDPTKSIRVHFSSSVKFGPFFPVIVQIKQTKERFR